MGCFIVKEKTFPEPDILHLDSDTEGGSFLGMKISLSRLSRGKNPFNPFEFLL